ncbi:phage-like protein [Clostridium putrefaciens]|uniref:Phage-like protein n=1 Tax=Clostridium putrefaciens TaxID=99675 RepID=A0A381J901_9CLOT|nr:hypothetical protein [Clostridium putrefaciens]SUY47691.1 phage-like protein [Clostridium putrefaciens]
MYRETISFNKDLINNNVIKLNKKKPISNIRGIATVELYDLETGNKVYHAETENLINGSVMNLMFFDFFYRRLMVGGDIQKGYVSFPFRKICLTDYGGIENVDEKLMKGKVIGWCDKNDTYAGDDAYQGTINLSESYCNPEKDGKIKIHFVFDFPTHASNGTFQTIYWCRDNGNRELYAINVNGTGSDSTIDKRHTVIRSLKSITYNCSDYDNIGYCLYLTTNSSVEYRTFKSFFLDSCANNQAEDNYFYKDDGSKMLKNDFKINGISADSKYLYLYNIKNDGIDIYVFQKDGSWVEKISKSASSYKDASGLIPTIESFKVIDGVPYMTVSYYIKGVYVSHFLKLNANYDIETDYTIDTPSGEGTMWSINILGKTKEYWIFSDNNKYLHFYDNSLKPIINGILAKRSMPSAEYAIYFFSKSHNYGYCFGYTSGSYSDYYYCYIFGLSLIGAQTLLAAPVTKTPTNTMKIQYDFIIDNILDGIF